MPVPKEVTGGFSVEFDRPVFNCLVWVQKWWRLIHRPGALTAGWAPA